MKTKSYGLYWSMNETDNMNAVEQVKGYIRKSMILTTILVITLCVISLCLQVFSVSYGINVLGALTMGMLVSLIWVGIIRIFDAYRIIKCLEIEDTLI